MADKPRVKAPKQRASSSTDGPSRNRAFVIGAAIAGVALGFVVVAVLLGVVGGGDGADEEAARTSPGRGPRDHGSRPRGRAFDHAARRTRTSGHGPTTGPPWYGIAIFGIYEDELEIARVVHNLEHGGIFILYGDEVLTPP